MQPKQYQVYNDKQSSQDHADAESYQGVLFLNQKSVDADFLELFEDLRLKISSKMTSPLVVLSSIDFDLLMSERLMLFHILTLDTAEHEGLEVERPKSKLLDLIQREKYFNIGNLFNQIFSQLKEESGLDVVDLLSNAL